MATARIIIDTVDSIGNTIRANGDGEWYYVKSTYTGAEEFAVLDESGEKVLDESGNTVLDEGTDLVITASNIKLEFAPDIDMTAILSLIQINPTTGNISITAGPKTILPDIDVIAGTGFSLNLFSATAGEIRHITAGSKTTINGNGPGSTIGRVASTQDDFIVERVSINSKSGPSGDTAARAILFSGADRCVARYCNIIDSSDDGIGVSSGGDCAVYGCTVQDADNAGIFVDSARCRVISNHVLGASVDGLEIGANGDNGVYQANYITDGATNPININAGASNNIFTACQFINQDDAIGGTDSLVIDCQLVPAADSVDLWLDANDGVTGDPVSSWVESVSSVDFTESTDQPDFQATGGPNSKPIIDFDGTNDKLDTAVAALSSTAGSLWLVISKGTVDSSPESIFAISDKAVVGDYFILGTEATTGRIRLQHRIGGGSTNIVTSTNGVSASNDYIIGLISNGSTWRIRLNGQEETIIISSGSNTGGYFGDLSAPDITTLAHHEISSTKARFSDVGISEVISTSAAPSENTINSIESYLNNKYAIY